jgi:signal transduction histidine kinase
MDKWIGGLLDKASGHAQESPEPAQPSTSPSTQQPNNPQIPPSVHPSIQQSINPTIHPSPPVGAGAVRIWFEDQGIGIEKRYQDKIWEMFQQLNKSYEGTGIGLALVRKAVERMGGKVGVESEPGRGSRFWVELKQAKSQTCSPPAHQTASR